MTTEPELIEGQGATCAVCGHSATHIWRGKDARQVECESCPEGVCTDANG